uniref:Small ribosomal subunit protein uS11c n=2 Tax=Phelipanche TaxID=320805 RepID=A0A1B1YYJ9_9LAMI|nr:ribosomal protein S11 [Phelipanche aegyptiaca]ANX10260.1 ribosomal protein S11 [Phelipanche lavandulacea]
MAKAIPKNVRFGSRKNVRFGPRRNVRFGSRGVVRFASRRNVRIISKGIIHVQASLHNTIVTVTDMIGQVVSWSSAGSCGFKGPRRGTPFAAQTATEEAISIVHKKGMQRAGVIIKGPGIGRDAALRVIGRSGIQLTFIRDVTPVPHNGCRPPKKRRI